MDQSPPAPLRELFELVRERHLGRPRLIQQLRAAQGESKVVGEILIRMEVSGFPLRRIDAAFSTDAGPQFRELKDHLPDNVRRTGLEIKAEGLEGESRSTNCVLNPFVWNQCPVEITTSRDDWKPALEGWLGAWIDQRAVSLALTLRRAQE